VIFNWLEFRASTAIGSRRPRYPGPVICGNGHFVVDEEGVKRASGDAVPVGDLSGLGC
jgi:hypothetical protein